MVLRRRMFCARKSGWNPSDWIASLTLPKVLGRTVSGAFRVRETVPTETPEALATSRIVAGFPVVLFTQTSSVNIRRYLAAGVRKPL